MDNLEWEWMKWMGKWLKNRREATTTASYTAAGR